MTSRLILWLWLAGVIGNLALFSTLCFKGQWRRLPVFTAIAGYEVIRAAILLPISHHGNHQAYEVAYWCTEAVEISLQLAFLLEILLRLNSFASSFKQSRPTLYLPWHHVAMAVGLAGALTMLMPSSASVADTADMRVSIFTSLLTCEIFLLTVRQANRLALRLPPHMLAITSGLTVWIVVTIVSSLAQEFRGWENKPKLFDIARATSTLLILIYWTGHFWHSQSSGHRALRTSRTVPSRSIVPSFE